MTISTSREGTLTAICAHDQREAREVRRDLGLSARDTIAITSKHHVYRLYGMVGPIRVVETRHFHDRSDAAAIRDALTSNVPIARFEVWPRPGRLLVEQHGGAGMRGLDAIAAAAAPKGTRPHHYVARLVSAGACEDMPVWERFKEDMAGLVGEPHLLLVLAAEDYSDDKLPAESEFFERGCLAVYAVALQADSPDYAVLRPGAGLPDGWLHDDVDGRWITRPSSPLYVVLRAATELQFPPEQGHASPTGRLEVRDDGAIAEVWEVTA